MAEPCQSRHGRSAARPASASGDPGDHTAPWRRRFRPVRGASRRSAGRCPTLCATEAIAQVTHGSSGSSRVGGMGSSGARATWTQEKPWRSRRRRIAGRMSSSSTPTTSRSWQRAQDRGGMAFTGAHAGCPPPWPGSRRSTSRRPSPARSGRARPNSVRWPGCAVPGCGGAFSRDREDALWQAVFTAQPARRRVSEPVGRMRPTQAAKEGSRALAARHGLNPKTVRLGWGARIRTWEWRYQKPLPYRLATPQERARV